MAVFKGVTTKKSQRKPGRKTRKADRTKRTKIKQIEAAKLRAQGARKR